MTKRSSGWWWCLMLFVLLGGCGREPATGVSVDPTRMDGNVAGDDDAGVGQPARPCRTKPDGVKCGSALHCIQQHCVANTCGDHVVAGAEECDDGNLLLGDGCDAHCKKERPVCGDGRVDLGEECDDENTVNDDTCSNRCTKNACGNKRVELREECDDGNQVDSDACSNHCTLNACGNGRVDPGEACDDGNKNDNDGCTNKCSTARCGNGMKEAKEECDDGNSVDVDMCSNACTANVCGNGRIDPNEACDGDAVGLMCTNNCLTPVDVCGDCEKTHCRDFEGQGVDLVAGCYENPDPSFVQKCVDAISCAREKDCAYTPRGAEQCYCGSAPSAQCQLAMGVDGPCKAAFEAAAGNADPVFVTGNFGNRSLPIGNAVYMLQCDAESCADVCTPKP